MSSIRNAACQCPAPFPPNRAANALQIARAAESTVDTDLGTEILPLLTGSHPTACLLCAELATACTTAAALGAEPPAAVFEGQETLLRPKDYRQWVVVGSSLGLRYRQVPEASPIPCSGRRAPKAYRPLAVERLLQTACL